MLGGGGIEQKGTRVLWADMDNRVGIAGWEEGIRGLHGNGKYTTKILREEVFILKQNSSHSLKAIY